MKKKTTEIPPLCEEQAKCLQEAIRFAKANQFDLALSELLRQFLVADAMYFYRALRDSVLH